MDFHLFAQKLIHLESIDSTNSYAIRQLSAENFPEGTVISAGEQTGGKGQVGNSWNSSPNENLTFSVVLKPDFLPLRDQFFLTLFSSLGCADYVSSKLQNSDRIAVIRIKWPNDLLVNGAKVAGLLIENQVQGSHLRASILGIGLNVNQLFQNESFTATSLSQITGMNYLLGEELSLLCKALERRYLQLRGKGAAKLKSDYLDLLFGKDELRTFLIKGTKVQGIITGVDQDGKLEVQFENEKRKFGNKEIEFLI